METVATEDDCFELRPNPVLHANFNPQGFEFSPVLRPFRNVPEEHHSEHTLWKGASASAEDTSGRVPNKEKPSKRHHFTDGVHAHHSRSEVSSKEGSRLASLVILVGRLALASVAFACFMFFTNRKRPSVIVPESLLA
eukprot:gnl/MRDRNA2_/MRDRNA2_447829_c0_seq1.p1 gnl/MRDRNA2_/MRDRNA2_447829_c0~~gnl/MRDRNA2_/MRDRNA2_447829_c0_seq1.p1  ORF type:complete len:162 (-),score=21.82 gnl/MRDRNA2_/MRDRNA2_447829_c0_seq1:94-507(-)